jgi:serine/threonine-protein kinase
VPQNQSDPEISIERLVADADATREADDDAAMTPDGTPFTLKAETSYPWEGKITFKGAVSVFAKVAEGLTYLHDEKHIVHRDLNPFNIVVTADLDPKIIDLDFTIIEQADTAGMYRRSGTVAYLSPEQVRGHHLDHRVDIYAFGVTMYEVLTGTNPYWEREEPSEQLRMERTTYNHLVLIPEAPSILRSYIPHEHDALIMGCLETDRDERIQNASEVAKRLHEISDKIQ